MAVLTTLQKLYDSFLAGIRATMLSYIAGTEYELIEFNEGNLVIYINISKYTVWPFESLLHRYDVQICPKTLPKAFS